MIGKIVATLLAGMTCAVVPAVAAGKAPPAPAQEAVAANIDTKVELAGEIIMSNQEKRYPEARRLLEDAAPAERPDALNNLATMLYYGMGGSADRVRASKLRHRSAELGSLAAKMTLVEFYQSGDDLHPKDPERAYRLATEVGEATPKDEAERALAALAQWRVAMMLLQGAGATKYPAAAYRWTSRAAENGHPEAMVSRAVMLATGDGVAEDDIAARSWYRKAAELRVEVSSHALRGLGAMLLTGEGGAADKARGAAYLLVAGAMGDEHARGILDAFRDELTGAERERALAIAGEELEKWPSHQ